LCEGLGPISADLIKTNVNLPCYALFEGARFSARGSEWTLAETCTPAAVPFVAVEFDTPFC
jgi:hypothetical protein